MSTPDQNKMSNSVLGLMEKSESLAPLTPYLDLPPVNYICCKVSLSLSSKNLKSLTMYQCTGNGITFLNEHLFGQHPDFLKCTHRKCKDCEDDNSAEHEWLRDQQSDYPDLWLEQQWRCELMFRGEIAELRKQGRLPGQVGGNIPVDSAGDGGDGKQLRNGERTG